MKRFIKKFNEACLALDNSRPFSACNYKAVKKPHFYNNDVYELYDVDIEIHGDTAYFSVWESAPSKFHRYLIFAAYYSNGKYTFDYDYDGNLNLEQRDEKRALLAQFGITGDDIQ